MYHVESGPCPGFDLGEGFVFIIWLVSFVFKISFMSIRSQSCPISQLIIIHRMIRNLRKIMKKIALKTHQLSDQNSPRFLSSPAIDTALWPRCDQTEYDTVYPIRPCTELRHVLRGVVLDRFRRRCCQRHPRPGEKSTAARTDPMAAHPNRQHSPHVHRTESSTVCTLPAICIANSRWDSASLVFLCKSAIWPICDPTGVLNIWWRDFRHGRATSRCGNIVRVRFRRRDS